MKYRVLKSMLSIMLISTLSFTAVGCGNEASQEGVSAVFGTMESEDKVVDNISDTSEPQVVADNSDTQSTEEDTQVKEDTQIEENDSQETSSESSEESKDNSNTGSSKEDKPSESHRENKPSENHKDDKKDDRPSETRKDDKKDDNHEEHKHTHTWKPVYKTVHHKAVTHKEDKGHYEDKGYDKTVVHCNTCKKEFTTMEALHAHQDATIAENPDDDSKWHGGSSTYTKHVEKKVWVSKWVTVVDKEAWDEKVLDHYECSCGATKKK